MRSTLVLLTLLVCTSAQAQEADTSHPGGSLDEFVHQLRVGYAAPVESQAPSYAAPLQSSLPTGASYSTTTYYEAERYPTHSVSWHIIGSRESREELINHLTTHPEHYDVRAVYTARDLRRMTRAQLQTLHDDSHNRSIARTTRVVSATVVPVASEVTVVRQPAQVRYTWQPTASSCPGGVCPPRNRYQRRAYRYQARAEARADRASAGLLGVGAQFGLINISK